MDAYERRVGKNYKLKSHKKFRGKTLRILSLGDQDDIVDDWLERIGVTKEKDRTLILDEMKELVKPKPESGKANSGDDVNPED